MLILEYAIETFFIFSGAYLGHVDRSEYINWLFIFALFFYLFHYMVNIKFGKTIVSINMDLRNKIYNVGNFFEWHHNSILFIHRYILYFQSYHWPSFRFGNIRILVPLIWIVCMAHNVFSKNGSLQIS